jgi:hypothetical protein
VICSCCDPPTDVWWAGLRIPFAGYVLGFDPAQFYHGQLEVMKDVGLYGPDAQSRQPTGLCWWSHKAVPLPPPINNDWGQHWGTSPPKKLVSVEPIVFLHDEILPGNVYRIPLSSGVNPPTTEVTVTRIDSVGCGPVMVTFVGCSGAPYTMTLAGFREQLRRALS